MTFWCYCAERQARIMSATCCNIYSLNGLTPLSKLTGEPTDISALSEFDWYEWVYWRDDNASYPFPHERLGRALGPCNSVGTAMSQWVLNNDMKVIPVLTARKLTKDELLRESERRKREEFDRAVNSKFGSSTKGPSKPIDLAENNEAYPCLTTIHDMTTSKTLMTTTTTTNTSIWRYCFPDTGE